MCRLVCRFMEGTCNFGDRCNYAHGEADLRQLPPEGHKILENKAKMDASRMNPPADSPSDSMPRGQVPDGNTAYLAQGLDWSDSTVKSHVEIASFRGDSELLLKEQNAFSNGVCKASHDLAEQTGPMQKVAFPKYTRRMPACLQINKNAVPTLLLGSLKDWMSRCSICKQCTSEPYAADA